MPRAQGARRSLPWHFKVYSQAIQSVEQSVASQKQNLINVTKNADLAKRDARICYSAMGIWPPRTEFVVLIFKAACACRIPNERLWRKSPSAWVEEPWSKVACVAKPDTILSWYRKLAAQTFDGFKNRGYRQVSTKKIARSGSFQHVDVVLFASNSAQPNLATS